MKRITIAIFMAVMMVVASGAYASAKRITIDSNLEEAVEAVTAALDNDHEIDSLVNAEVYENWANQYELRQQYRSAAFNRIAEFSIVALAILVGPLMIITLVIIIQRGKRKRLLDRYHFIETLVKSNQPLPKNVLYTDLEQPDSYRRLRSSLMWIAVSFGIFIFSWLVKSESMMGLSTIPLLIGVAFLAVYLVARRDSKLNQDAPTDDAQQD